MLRVNETPLLPLGEPGTFDEHGIMPSCTTRNNGRVFLYYSGWSRSVSVPYTNYTGLAISDDEGETFRKISVGPVLGKSRVDPFSATSPSVVKIGNIWHMWYCSGTGWRKIRGNYEHTYDIKHACSEDGIDWKPSGEVSVAQRTEDEAITRPFVLENGDGYDMWFCYRGCSDFRDGEDAYRVGYAYSDDLLQWRREDNCLVPQ